MCDGRRFQADGAATGLACGKQAVLLDKNWQGTYRYLEVKYNFSLLIKCE